METKAEASGFKKSWATLEKEVQQELNEASPENVLADQLRVLAGAWLGTWWICEIIKMVKLQEFKGQSEGS